MQEITVKASKPYSVYIGNGIAKSEKLILDGADKVMVVTDENVGKLYLEKVVKSLKNAGKAEIHSFVMGTGEKNKTEDTAFKIITELSRKNFGRRDEVIALGGGVVGDTAGFAASIFMRGIRVVQVPTTLLSAIDSSVGGKTAVNVGGIKNVAGTFHQPEGVFIDVDIINGIDDRLFLDGMGEGVKYAILSGGRLAEIVSRGTVKENIEEFIALSVKCKAEVVAADEFEGGYRRVLNLGHTIGHAVETLSGHGISHGEAVAIGIGKITAAAHKLGLVDSKTVKNVNELIKIDYDSVEFPLEKERAIDIIAKDKKCGGGKISIVYPTEIGHVEIAEIKLDELKSVIE